MKKYILLSLFFCTASILMGQEKKLTISGHVFDENNESLPGVSVYLKDRAGVGTSTDHIFFYWLQKERTHRPKRRKGPENHPKKRRTANG